MSLTRIDALDDPRVADYRDVADGRLIQEKGLFVAEGRLVVERLLQDGRYRVRSVLVREREHGAVLRLPAIEKASRAPFPVYTASVDLMRRLTGFDFHRGCLALAERPAPRAASEVLRGPSGDAVAVVLEEISNADNVGGVFRNAAAFGVRAVLLSPGGCDPLYRKAIRTSMAATLRVPFARVAPWPDGLSTLHAAGFSIVALTPAPGARDLAAFARDRGRSRRLALLVGTEGAGLSAAAEAFADAHVRIPMAPGVDSLNLATATGIALYELALSKFEV